ncbi:MAG TPA: ABC transporter permease, partial [Thermoanaerobaculia bacterium]|nr:ABC transporter permease [Thermoanaerobaculia bacterium]
MIRIYRAALRLLPPAVREEHGETMTALFADLLADARRRKGAAGALLLIVSEIAALVRFAWSERRRERSGRPRRSASGFDEPPLRHARGGREPLLLSILHDLRGAGRALGSTPGFTFVCVATIALAIGANTAIFSIVNAVLLEPLPYPGADRIVVLGHYSDGGDELDTTTPGNFYDWQARATAFESMAAFSYTERTLATGDDAERVLGALVTGELFEVLRRPPAHGRTLARSDDAPGAERVIVLSDGLARRLFGDPDATGRVVSLGGHPCTVIGVMPPDFVFPDYDARFWVPARFDAEFRDNRDQFFLRGVARLKDGVTIDEARAQLDTVMDGIRREHPLFTGKVGAAVLPMKELLVDDVRPRLMTLMSAVVLVLLIASANVGNLLLARSVARRREIAVRRALGARTGRLIRQTLTESLLLGAIGGIAGLAVGKALLAALMAWLPPELPRASGFGLDPAVFAFTSLISLLAGLAFGLVPAIQLGLAPSADAMREGIRGTARGRRLRSALVVSEVALALMLLTAAGLLVRSFANLVRVDPGFRPDPALTFTVGVSGPAYEENQQRDAFFEALEERLRRIPSVEGVARSSTLPVAGRGTGAWFNIIDRPTPPGQTPPSVPYRVVNPDYFRVLGIPIVRGRSLEETDGAEMRAVVISESV